MRASKTPGIDLEKQMVRKIQNSQIKKNKLLSFFLYLRGYGLKVAYIMNIHDLLRAFQEGEKRANSRRRRLGKDPINYHLMIAPVNLGLPLPSCVDTLQLPGIKSTHAVSAVFHGDSVEELSYVKNQG